MYSGTVSVNVIENVTILLCNLALQENMQILLNKIREECNRMMALHTQFMSDCKKVSYFQFL